MTKRERANANYRFDLIRMFLMKPAPLKGSYIDDYTERQAKANELLKISRSLSRFAEHLCNGTIQEEEDGTYSRYYEAGDGVPHKVGKASDRYKTAEKRIKAILEGTGKAFYFQTDPRGCALYLYDPKEVSPEKIDQVYVTRGLAVY